MHYHYVGCRKRARLLAIRMAEYLVLICLTFHQRSEDGSMRELKLWCEEYPYFQSDGSSWRSCVIAYPKILLIDLKNNACFLHFCIIFQEVHTVQRKSLTWNCDIGHHPTLLLTVPSAELNETQTEKLIKQMFHSVVEFKLSRYNTAAKFCS